MMEWHDKRRFLLYGFERMIFKEKMFNNYWIKSNFPNHQWQVPQVGHLKSYLARMPLPGWTKTAWKLMLLYPLRRIPLWRFQGIFQIQAGLAKRSTRLNLVRSLHVWSVKISERVVATNASTKMTSQIFKKTSTACVFHVCWLKFLLYPEKRICPGKVGYEFRWITALSLYDCFKKAQLRKVGQDTVHSTVLRRGTCDFYHPKETSNLPLVSGRQCLYKT